MSSNAFNELHERVVDGEAQEVLRDLRTAPVTDSEFAILIGLIGRVMELDELAQAGADAAGYPDSAAALYHLGYALMEVGLAELAVRPLESANAMGFEPQVVVELAAVYDNLDRNAEAADLLARHEPDLPLPGGFAKYLIAYHQLQAGRLNEAIESNRRLGQVDPEYAHAVDGLRTRLARAEACRAVTPLDHTDLRGWQYVLDGTILLGLSPWGFDSMAGRYGYVSDDYDQISAALHRLRMVLDAVRIPPRTVRWLPDRDSTILGLAASRLFGVPGAPYTGVAEPNSLVVAYALDGQDEQTLRPLLERAPGQVLFVHTANWSSPGPVVPDVASFVAQFAVQPWGERMRAGSGPKPEVQMVPADASPPEQLADRILRTPPQDRTADDGAPADPPGRPAHFASAIAGTWLTGNRLRLPGGSGPVRSASFG